MGGRAHRRTRALSGRAGGRVDERTGAGMLGGQVDGGGQWADGGGRVRGWADRRIGRRMGGRRRTGGRRISEGKTPNLTRHLTWPWEIQRGRPRVTIKLLDLPPLSR